jgi:predicted dehydrogenase
LDDNVITDPIRVGIIGVHPEKGWAIAAHIPALRQLALLWQIVDFAVRYRIPESIFQ